MPTRIDWLPYGINERVSTLRSIASGAETYKTELGLSQTEVDRMKAIAEEYAFAAAIYERNRVNLRALRMWRDSVLSNKPSKKTVDERPMFDNTPMPVGTKAGLIAEMRKYVRQIKSRSGYRDGMGIAMNILTPNHVKKPLGELQPVMKTTAVEGFRVRIACEMQGMDAIRVEYLRNGEETWQNVAFLTSLPETIYIEPAVLGVPETGRIRCRFLKKNKLVGQHSNMQIVTIYGS